jgi:hypothetical protein
MAKKKSTLKSPVTFSLGSVLLFVLIFGAVGGYAVWKSLAAPNKSAPTVSLLLPAGATSLHYGDNFYVAYTDSSDRNYSDYGYLACTANSTSVLSKPSTGIILDEYRFASPHNGTIGSFQLLDPLNNEYVGGGANCTVSLLGSKQHSGVLAQTSFVVNP